MKKTLLYIAVFTSITIPSVTFASWYNPFSWFKKAPEAIVEPVEMPVQTQIIEPVAPTPLPVSKPIITNTITVTDPKLQSQINTLIQQNTTLQTQLASLTTQYNALIKENGELKNEIATLKIVKNPPSLPLKAVVKSSGNGKYTFTNLSDQTIHIVAGEFLGFAPQGLSVQSMTVSSEVGTQTQSLSSLSLNNDPTGNLIFNFNHSIIVTPGSTTNFAIENIGSLRFTLNKIDTIESINVDGIPL